MRGAPTFGHLASYSLDRGEDSSSMLTILVLMGEWRYEGVREGETGVCMYVYVCVCVCIFMWVCVE